MWRNVIGGRRITLSVSFCKNYEFILGRWLFIHGGPGAFFTLCLLYFIWWKFLSHFPQLVSFSSTTISILNFLYFFCWLKLTYICWKFCGVISNWWPGSFILFLFLFILFISVDIHCNIWKEHIYLTEIFEKQWLNIFQVRNFFLKTKIYLWIFFYLFI